MADGDPAHGLQLDWGGKTRQALDTPLPGDDVLLQTLADSAAELSGRARRLSPSEMLGKHYNLR
jgi:hypothetical protein